MQNYMFLGLKSSYKAIFSLHFAHIVLAAFAILAGLTASGSVFLNDLYFWVQSSHYINPYLCLIAFLLAFSPGVWGLAAIIFLLPLSAGLGTQLNAYLGTHFLILPNAGLDLVAGVFLGSTLREIVKASHFFGKNSPRDLTAAMKELAPWPIALVIVMITISTAIAISRNVYQSAAATSFKGLLFNLVHFRPIGWHDDYMPISDWISYALAVAMIILVIGQLKNKKNKNQIIFRPIMAGLIIGSLMSIAQAITGIGLPENLLSFRKDQLGYAVIGFQPDLHAFAGHMLLGAVGLWGYFYSGISKLERKLVLLVVALSWAGLILSKSRALLLIALAAMFFWLVWYLWQQKRRFVLPTLITAITAIGIFVVMIFNYSSSFSGIPVLSWLGELANEFKSRDLTSWSLLSGIFGSRFEIWEAAIRMWWEFPLMGVGQGNFYRLSDIASFSKSHFLILNHGENAHNYFLQTLTETGVIGLTVFAIALLTPLLTFQEKKIYFPAAIALLSLFLGNIFAHSFLVRENLLFASLLLGVIYSSLYKSSSLFSKVLVSAQINAHSMKVFGCMLLMLIVLLMCCREIYISYKKFPFYRGILCFVDRGISADGWSSGVISIPMPIGSNRVQLLIDSAAIIGGPKVDYNNLKASLSNQGGRIDEKKFQMHGKLFILEFRLSNNEIVDQKNVIAQIVTPACFTPRNLGIGLDARRLGVLVLKSGAI